MRLFSADHWLRAPTNREIIARWSPPAPSDLPPPADRYRIDIQGMVSGNSDEWEFLVIGDTGDSDAFGAGPSPQDAVARELARDAMEPVGRGNCRLVLHTGDVIYMAGERRLYERNFRRPYTPFLTPESTVENMVFRLPFLPVPGNHDYYDLGGWVQWLSRIPFLRAGVRLISNRFLGYGIPEGGSDMGKAFMDAFLIPSSPKTGSPVLTANDALPYLPGISTRLPNRYYQFTIGNADFFALDSNTLDGPPPSTSPPAIRQAASQRVAALEKEAREINAQIQQEQKVYNEQRQAERSALAASPARQAELRLLEAEAEIALNGLASLLSQPRAQADKPYESARTAVEAALRDWKEAHLALQAAQVPEAALQALSRIDTAGDTVCNSLTLVEAFLATLPAGSSEHALLTAANSAVERTQARLETAITPTSTRQEEKLRTLSEQALDIQRELAYEQARQHYQSEDYDAAQIEWLRAALEEAEQRSPDNWRILFLHHPLYTTILNHCEHPDVRELRANLLNLLNKPGRVHLILAGHAHTFEWIRSASLPDVGLFVTGGGGQSTLRASVFTARYRDRSFRRRQALRDAGVQECAIAGRGPVVRDWAGEFLYHYLRVVVRPDTIQVYPVGIRMSGTPGNGEHRFRREEPMPVYHVAELPRSLEEARRPVVRLLRSIEVRRDRPPESHWQ